MAGRVTGSVWLNDWQTAACSWQGRAVIWSRMQAELDPDAPPDAPGGVHSYCAEPSDDGQVAIGGTWIAEAEARGATSAPWSGGAFRHQQLEPPVDLEPYAYLCNLVSQLFNDVVMSAPVSVPAAALEP